MKTFKIQPLVLLLSVLTLFGCQKSTQDLTDTEKNEVEESIRQIMNDLDKTVEDHDFEKMMEYSWNDKDYIYVGNGTITKGWKNNYDVASTIHSNPKHQSFNVSYDELIVKVLSRDMAMVIGDGYFNNFPTDEGTKSLKMAVTFLFERIEGKWLLTVGHESTDEAINF